MSNLCGNDGIKIDIVSKSKLRGFATKLCKVRARSRVKCLFKAGVSVLFQGFVIGSGESEPSNNFGSSNFGDTPRRNPPQILVRSISGSGGIRINTTIQTIRRCSTDLPKAIFDITSQEYIDRGYNAIPDSIYSPFNSNNSIQVNSKGPLIEHSLITQRKRSSNSRLIANLGRPVNNMGVKLTGIAKVKSRFFEKLHGHFDIINSFDNFIPTEKLFPIRDINNKKNGISFVTERTKSSEIYKSINEGVHVGNITKHGAKGFVIADDIDSFITPSSIYTEGEFTYKCEVNAPSITPLETFFFLRASAPLTNFDSDIPPTYEVSNIKLEDPYGNLIAKYKDFTIRGEQDYSDKDHHHYVTYVTEPEVNYAKGNTWDYYYPVLGEDSGYTLSLDIKGNCFFHAFEEDSFNKGFQDGCNLDDKFVQSSNSDYLGIDGAAFSTQSKNYFVRPTDALRISAIEINNKGSLNGILHDNKLNMFLDVVPTGLLLERVLRPQKILSTNYTNNIYPTNTINIWQTSPDIDGNRYDNTVDSGKNNYELKDRLSNEYIEGHLTLIDTDPIADSGKIQLFYSHQDPKRVKVKTGGALNIGNKYEGAFSRPEIKQVFPDDNYFIVEEIFLRIDIKKDASKPDFPIDVVGYSDDGVMISTKQVGGFLQNASSGVGTVPLTTGFDDINELGFSSETMSDKFAYYSRPITPNPAGDHYRLEDSVIVTNSSDFKTYDVPLKIYEDKVELGRSRDYRNSRLFEALYLDIYPIPSGTEISKADLVIKYKPSVALALNTLGCDQVRIGPAFSLLTPIKSYAGNNSDGYILSNIPHAYETREPTLKTNYSKRWRGSSGLTSTGPFDADGFGFGFEFPQLDSPFSSGYYNFSDVDGTDIYSSQSSSLVGQLSNASMSNNIVRNIGMRFISDSLFPPPTEPPAPVTEDGFDLTQNIMYNYHIVGTSNGLNSANAITVRIPDEYDNRADDTDKTYVTPTLFTANYDGNARLYNRAPNSIGISGLWTLSVLVNDKHVGDIFTEQQSFSQTYDEFLNIDVNVGDEIALSGVTTSVNHVADEFNLICEYVGIHMNTYAPSYYKPYKTINWTESGHELEDNIVDAFDHAVRASGADGYINFGDVDTADGFAIFMRFSPDITVSGVNPDYNLWNSGVLFHKQDAGQDLEFGLKYNYGKLQAYAQDDLGNIISIEDTTDYTEYQYPLSVLLTYNANKNEKLKLYTHNEMATEEWTRLRAESNIFNLNDGNSDLTFAYDKENDIGFNAFVTEIGISNSHPDGGSNIVDGTPEKSYSQANVDTFFDTITTTHDDSNPLWQFVDNKTTEWNLGAFKYCSFGNDFNTMTTRNGEDYVYHTYYHDGLDYAARTDISLPESLSNASGVAYHSQVENDMLRFNVGGKSEEFYAIRPRIARAFPRSYMLAEDALRVNTVLQHHCDGDIFWPDGNKGAKLIVSLYTPAKESELTPTKNYGLINRATHYVNPEDCWNKIRSVFTLNDIKDKTSEPWAFFDTTITKQELSENYFSKEIDDMFIQYDLVYPSGGNYTESKITIHSLDVSLHDALTKEATVTDYLFLHSSGAFMQESDVNLFSDAKGISNDYLWLSNTGIAYVPSSGELWLTTSGTFRDTNDLMLMQPDVYGTATSDDTGSNFGANFGSEEDLSDPHRDSVKILLPFDNHLNDISINNHSASLIDQITPLLTSIYPTLSSNSVFENGQSANFVDTEVGSDWMKGKSTLKYEGVQFDPTGMDGDWMIDFWYNLYNTENFSGYESPQGAWRTQVGFHATIFEWGKWQRTEHGMHGAETKFVGMKLVWANGILSLKFGLNHYGAEATPYPEGWTWRDHHSLFDSSEGLSATGMAGSGDDITRNDNPADWVTYASIGVINRPDRPNVPHYNTDFYGYEDIRNIWSKFIIRKIGTVIQIFINEEKVAEADIGRWKFDSFDEVNYDPSLGIPDSNPLQFRSGYNHEFLLDDFRITMGSARSTDINSNPTTSPDAESNGLSISSPIPSRSPIIEPPPPPPPPTTPPPVIGLSMRTVGGYPNTRQDIHLYSTGTAELISSNATLPLNLLDYDNPNTLTNTFDLYVLCLPSAYTPEYTTIDAGFNLYSLAPPLAPTPYSDSIALFLEATPIILDVASNIPLFLQHRKPINSGPNQLESFVWDGDNYGVSIDVVDNSLASISANNEIRGVNTICYGSCDAVNNISCTEVDIYTHETLWNPSLCAEGGVARAIRTYSNPDVNAFGSDVPYDNHYYGMRKITNLIPLAPYNIILTGKTGSDKILEVPREIKEWEYGFKNASTGDPNKNINYTGLKLTAPVSNIESNHNFGKAVTVLGDRVIIGAPFEDAPVGVDDLLNSDTASYNLKDAGKIYIYKKAPEATGYSWTDQDDKAPFVLEQELVLPVGFRRDYYFETTEEFKDDAGDKLDFEATIRNWVNVGEGRQLGHSLDSASRGAKEVIVAGGPGSLWTREFSPIATTPVKIALMVFNNELVTNPANTSWRNIIEELNNRDVLYRYFSDPPVEFDIEIILMEPLLGLDLPFSESDEFDYPQPDFVSKHLVNRHYNFDFNSQEYKDQESIMLQELINVYHERFPLDSSALHNGIPPLFGIYIDNSRSLGTNAVGYFDGGLTQGAINKFIEYVKDYSYANGLKYFNNTPGYTEFNVTVKSDEDWITQSIECLKDLTDQTRLKNSGGFNLIANDIGTFNTNASEFNYPPASGGAVFVFEREHHGNFELVQHIESPSTYNNDVSDRFGHDVAISDDGKVIVIGSPFCEEAVQIWEYNDRYDNILDSSVVNGRFTEFLSVDHQAERLNQTFGEAYQAYERYITEIVNQSSPFDLLRDIYSNASESLKYKFILYANLNSYNKIKTVSYSSLFSGVGSWDRLYSRYIPTARLGYSVDVNEDGSLVAIGSPTDSLGERDSAMTWFRYDQAGGEQVTGYGGSDWQWQNYTNAGAVRLLESRDYYPHSRKVVEYYKFGNKHESIAPEEDSGLFLTSMRNLFASRGYDFSRTSFSEDKKIPQDAGLAFIITPEIDASSDEILDNIREWLAYGDRHLVLVADDPLYEQGGVYEDTNKIINYILKSLDINLRVYPSRNRYDALLEDTGLFFNVRTSFVPSKTTNSISTPIPLRASGVADIRFYDEGKSDLYSCDLPYGMRKSSDPFVILEQIDGLSSSEAGRIQQYRELHSRCELPIVHEGDLRAKYTDQCVYRSCKGESTLLNYQHNLGFMYGSHTTCNDWDCTICDEFCPPVLSVNDREASEPMPIMTAYESISKTINVPATPDYETFVKTFVGFKEPLPGVPYYDFTDIAYSGIQYMWSAESGNFSAIDYNINNTISQSLFFDPEEYNGQDALLQSKASVPYETTERLEKISDTFDFCAEERFEAFTESSVILIAGTYTEKKESLVLRAGDVNLNFYFNLLAKDVNGSCKVAQVGGFTQRASYQDGYASSDIQIQMLGLGINMLDTNVPTHELYDVSKYYDVAWIANSNDYPSDEEIEDIKRFLRLKNKKLVITYGQDSDGEDFDPSTGAINPSLINKAKIAEYICEKLNLTMKPRFLNGNNVYASTRNVVGDWQLTSYFININESSRLWAGFPTDPNTRIEEFYINNPPFGRRGRGRGYSHDVVPIEVNSASRVAYFDLPISDLITEEQGVPTFRTGITKVTFDVKEPKEDQDKFNLFKLFFSVSSESELESSPLEVFVNNCSTTVSHPSEATAVENGINVEDESDSGDIILTTIKHGFHEELRTENRKEYEAFIQIPSGVPSFDIFITGCRKKYELQSNPEYLRTNRLVSISGVRVKALEKIDENRPIPIYEDVLTIVPGTDAYSYEYDVVREISNSSAQYCFAANSDVCAEDDPAGYGTEANAPDIPDGPMVVAQAIYHQAGFFSGHNKSRVTVISDASLIQGRTTLLEDGVRVNPSLVSFLTGMYPATSFDSENYGRQYESEFKIISPERSSPSRLINAYPENSGLNHRFGQYPSNELALNKYSDDEGKKQITPVPPNKFVRQPFDGMLGLMDAVDPGKFRKLPKELQIPPGERFARMRPTSAGVAAKKAYEQAWYVDNFEPVQAAYASKTKLHDTYNGVTYEDAGYRDLIPPILRETGHDHLDLKVFNSGYPGDLFGYKVTLHKDKLYVGAPFAVYKDEQDIVTWKDVIDQSSEGIYGAEIGFNGGAGAVYVVERTGVIGSGVGSFNRSREITDGIAWDVTQKFRPEEINVGFSGINTLNSESLIGPNSYSDEFLKDHAFMPDMFGYDIALEGDILAISAPGHDFETFFEHTPGTFMRKEFNEQFAIPKVNSTDLGSSANRSLLPASGDVVINHGAVFTYENKIDNWGDKTQQWTTIHKVVGQGYNTRVQNSGENTFFGSALGLSRARRNDGDYILAVGASNHLFSNNNNTEVAEGGATYAYDGMLRKLRPAFSHPDTYISGRVFGSIPDKVDMKFNFSNGSVSNKNVFFDGRVHSDRQGQIFIEVSGQDKLEKGYVIHRPYIEKISGGYAFGKAEVATMPLISDGRFAPHSGVMPLISLGPSTGSVYNNMNLIMQRDLQTSGELRLYSSGINLFGQVPFGENVENTEGAKELENNIANINNFAFLVGRGGF